MGLCTSLLTNIHTIREIALDLTIINIIKTVLFYHLFLK